MTTSLTMVITGLLLLTTISIVSFSVAAEEQETIIIGFEGKVNEKLVRQYGADIIDVNTRSGTITADLDARGIRMLSRNSRIEFIEYDRKISINAQTLPYGVDYIDAEKVHPDYTGSGVKVAVLDTGIDYNHPDLDDNYKGGYDFVNDDAYPMDDHGHGTHCAGTIAAEDNDFGVLGVAPGVDLYGVKVLDSTGSGYTSWIAAGIDWAVENDMDVISMSLGSDYYSSLINNACDAAEEAGLVIVAAAGNDGTISGSTDTVDYPARQVSVIAVGALDIYLKRPSWSSTGPTLEIMAPGTTIYSTKMSNSYGTMSGTSMATPHVAGVAALMLEADATMTNAEIREQIQSTAYDLGASGRDNLYGYGMVDAEEAVGSGGGGGEIDEAPTVAITSPSDSDGITESVTIQATASDDNGVSKVEFYIGATLVGSDYSSPYTISWDTLEEENGDFIITAVATDTAGQTAEDSITVTVDNSEPEDPSSSMHIESIVMWCVKSGKQYDVYSEIHIVDEDGNGVYGATVKLSLTQGPRTYKYTGTTDSDGEVTFKKSRQKKGKVLTAMVTDVVLSGWAYDSASNVETSETIKVG